MPCLISLIHHGTRHFWAFFFFFFFSPTLYDAVYRSKKYEKLGEEPFRNETQCCCDSLRSLKELIPSYSLGFNCRGHFTDCETRLCWLPVHQQQIILLNYFMLSDKLGPLNAFTRLWAQLNWDILHEFIFHQKCLCAVFSQIFHLFYFYCYFWKRVKA